MFSCKRFAFDGMVTGEIVQINHDPFNSCSDTSRRSDHRCENWLRPLELPVSRSSAFLATLQHTNNLYRTGTQMSRLSHSHSHSHWDSPILCVARLLVKNWDRLRTLWFSIMTRGQHLEITLHTHLPHSCTSFPSAGDHGGDCHKQNVQWKSASLCLCRLPLYLKW